MISLISRASFRVPKISWCFRGCKCENRLNQLPLCWPARVLHPNCMATPAISKRKGYVTCSVHQGSNQDESQCSVWQSEDSAVIFPSIPKKDKECRKEHLDVWLSHLRATCSLKLIQLTSKQQFSVKKKKNKLLSKKTLIWWREKKSKEFDLVQMTQEFTADFPRWVFLSNTAGSDRKWALTDAHFSSVKAVTMCMHEQDWPDDISALITETHSCPH